MHVEVEVEIEEEVEVEVEVEAEVEVEEEVEVEAILKEKLLKHWGWTEWKSQRVGELANQLRCKIA